MELSIIIVNYKTPYLLLRCVESIYATTTLSDFEIIVVDNASHDDSEKVITNRFPKIKWIQKKENDGFGRANNIGFRESIGDYLLFVNSDMILLPDTIDRCIIEIKKNPKIGVLGCKLFNEDGSIQKSKYSGNGSCFDILESNLVMDYMFSLNKKEKKIRALMGSFMLIPRGVLEIVGLFDPDYFMYSEEIDLCRRIEKSKFFLMYFDEVGAIHKHGGSSSNNVKANKQKYLSNALLQYKTRGIINYLFYHQIFVFNSITNFIAMWLLAKNYRKAFWQQQLYYFSNVFFYLTIPFLYSRKTGNGKRLLRRS